MIARIRRIALAGLVLTVTAVAAPSTSAQQTPATPAVAAQHQATSAGPTVDRAAAGVRPLTQEADPLADPFAPQRRAGLGRPAALMVVGFGAMIVGLIIEGDVGTLIAIAGAAIGLYGLYHYLK